ncbi:MAG: tetratricopeptide repeat protein [Phycisphaerae bacterium]
MFQRLKDGIQGRWQAPLGVLAVVVAVFAAIRLNPSAQGPEFEAICAELHDARLSGNASAAADTAANLLQTEPAPTAEEQAFLHDFIADILYDTLLEARNPTIPQAERMLEHAQAARHQGTVDTPRRKMRIADGLYWSNRLPDAARNYREVLQLPIDAADKRTIARRLVAMSPPGPEGQTERQTLLRQILDDETAPVEEIWWALQQELSSALAQKDIAAARLLIDQHGTRLRTSDLRGYLDYLDAWVLVHEGRTAEAAPLVQWIDDWLGKQPLREDLLDQFGHLPAMNRWLMGRIHLTDNLPEKAIESFESAIQIQPSGSLLVGALIGKGQALAKQDRHVHACEAFAEALAAIRKSVQLDALRTETANALRELFNQQRDAGRFETAAEYVKLAIDVTPQDALDQRVELLEALGTSSLNAAGHQQDRTTRGRYYAQSGDAFAQAATSEQFDMDRRAALQWRAAQSYDKAGRNRTLRNLLSRFIEQRSNDPRLPTARLMLGQAHEIAGDHTTALKHYRAIMADYPKLEEAARAQLLSAGCLLQLGEQNVPEAEQLLADLLSNDYVAPDANVFREALLSLADLQYNAQRYGDAISRLQGFLERFPDDVARTRAHFQLSDSYRLSAFALREAAMTHADAATVFEQSKERFREALRNYSALRDRLGGNQERSEADAVYYRLATLYEADCLAELNEPESIDTAILKYRRAAAEFDRSDTALVALVQIANLHLRRGETVEAARAIERARWLVQSLPQEGFSTSIDGYTRADWKRYLELMTSSHLFRNVFAAK